MKRQRIWMAVGALIALFVIGGLFGYQQYQVSNDDTLKGGPVELPSTQGDFSLTQLEQDQFAVLFFGYTYCSDVCPMSLAVMRQVMQGLDEAQRNRVVPLLVSVDPERDTLERLAEYEGYFGEDFVGATGSEEQLRELADRYGVIWRRVETAVSAVEFTIGHSFSLYLVDRNGAILQRVLYSPTPHMLRSAVVSEIEG